MKAMKLTGIKQIEMMDIAEPQLKGSRDVKIRMVVTGICGSDIHYYQNGKIGSQVVVYPFTVGHEGAGIVTETGDEVKRVVPGDLIAIEPAMPCWQCDQCRSGRHHTCRRLRFLGCPGQAEGCLMEYIVMPEESCFPLPANLSADQGAISEPLAIGVYSVRRSSGIKGATAGILGFGPIGMSVMLAARAGEASRIYVTDKLDPRIKIATRQKVTWAGNPTRENIVEEIKKREPLGLDIVFECCGQQEAADQAVELLKPGGRLVIAGIPEFNKWSFDADNIRRKELDIRFVRRQVDCVDESLELMSTGKINVDAMVTHRFPFEKTKEAFDLVAGYSDGVMKAMIDF